MAFLLFAFVALLGSVHCQFGSLQNECNQKEMDIFFLLDSSTSIYINDYMEQLQFVRNVVNQLEVDERYTRVGILTYSDDFTRPVMKLSRSRNNADVLTSINELNLPYRTGVTNTHIALRYVREDNEFRSSVTKVMVVVTDGGSRQQSATAREAQFAKDQGFYVYVVGVGQYRDESEWRTMASSPTDRFIFNVTDFRQLNFIANQLPIRACPLPPLLVGMCDVQQQADVIFMAGPANNERAYDIIEKFIERTRDQRRYLSYTPLLDICSTSRSASAIRADDIDFLCDRLNEQGVADEQRIRLLLQQVDDAITRNMRNRLFTNQVVVVFMDDEVYNYARFSLLNEIFNLETRSNVQVVFAGMGLSNADMRNILSRTRDAVNFDSSPLEYQESTIRELTVLTCEGINDVSPGPNIDAN